MWRTFTNTPRLIDKNDKAALKRLARLQARVDKEFRPTEHVPLYNPAHQELRMWEIVQGDMKHDGKQNLLEFQRLAAASDKFWNYANYVNSASGTLSFSHVTYSFL